MINKNQLINQLKKLGLQATDTVMVHSSMKAIGDVEGGPEGVLDVLINYFHGGLLLMPTHTWATVVGDHQLFNPNDEPSCVGLLTNLFLKRAHVYRSLHPTHSIAAYGPRAKDYVKGEEKFDTPCPRQGCWGRLIDEDAKIIFLGAPLTSNTFIHGIEEWRKIPSRLSNHTYRMEIEVEGKKIIKQMYRHFHPSLDVSHQYDKIKPLLEAKGLIVQGTFGHALTYVMKARDLYFYVDKLLQVQPNVFAEQDPLKNYLEL